MIEPDRVLPKPATAKPVRIGIVGEFNSGKSSLVNLLLRRPLLETSVDHAQLPPLRINLVGAEDMSGRGSDVHVKAKDQWLPVDGLPLTRDQIRQAEAVASLAPSEDFAGVILTEISVNEHGHLTEAAAEALDAVDFLVWCTMGQRAWCLSEIHIIEGIRPEQLEHSVLAITRSDYLDQAAQEMVLKRVGELAQPFFQRVLPIKASSRAIAAAGDDATWAESGGAALNAAVLDSLRAIRLRDSAEAASAATLSTSAPARPVQLTVVRSAEPDEPAPEPAVEAVANPFADPAAIAAAWAADLAELQTLAATEPPPEGALHAEILGRLGRLIARLPEGEDAPRLARTFRRAHALLLGRAADDLLAVDLALELRDRFSPADISTST